MQRHLKLYRLPDATKTEGLRKLKITDVPEACKLLNKVSTRKIARYIDHTKTYKRLFFQLTFVVRQKHIISYEN